MTKNIKDPTLARMLKDIKPTPNASNPALNLEFLNSITIGDIAFQKELLEIFLDSSGENLGRMNRALDNLDNDGWHYGSHNLKGASSSIGAFDLSHFVEYAQHHPKDSPAQKAITLEQVKSELVRTVIDVEAFLKKYEDIKSTKKA